MERYIAIDSGKGSSKIAEYKKDDESIEVHKFRTKIEKGNFNDDAIENNTAIMEYEGKVYKIGDGAIMDAEMITSKKTVTHKMCTLLAIAQLCSADEVDTVHVAIGIPVKNWEDVDARFDYKNFILPDGEISVKYKPTSSGETITKKFRIVSKHVYPETLGALFIGDNVNNGTVAVIDIGHLNINQTVFNGVEVDRVYSLTDESGGYNMLTGLAQELSSAFSLVDEQTVLRTLLRPERCLKPVRPNKEVEEKSKEIINEYLLNYVKDIRKRCAGKKWAIDYMNFIFIGGTSRLLKKEIHEVFGEQAIIPDDPEYANAIGFLRIMCGKLLKIKINIKR